MRAPRIVVRSRTRGPAALFIALIPLIPLITLVGMLVMVASAGAAVAAGVGGNLSVVSVTPTARSMTATTTSAISVEFDRPLSTATVTSASFWAFARWSGAVEGTITFSNGDRTATLTPTGPYTSGESVMVILSHDIQAQDGSFLRDAGYSFQFWTRAGDADLVFEQIDVLSTDPTQDSRAYGGIASDMNGDGWMDITIVNEDSADLRVFLNTANGSGLFDDYLQPTFPVGNRASPSEPSDFNRDGVVDICVADINDDTVSVLLGIGDGTLGPRQVIDVGDAPRGIAVLDVDGDGDTDIANTNSGSDSNVSVMLNDGNGVFGQPSFLSTALVEEWALAAADMNEDGILDLIIGGNFDNRVEIYRGGGDGTFSFLSSESGVGRTWMLVCGDVNGDGHEDIATVNSQNNDGSILLNDGAGNLTALADTMTDAFPLATDLADMDGDGDLDWITSSFGGDWQLFTNDGTGTFTFDQEFLAPSNASCSLPFDFDNDGDLDLALIDEIADVVILMRNTGAPCPADIDGSNGVDFQDLLALLAAWGPCAGCPSDVNGDAAVDFQDLLIVLAAWGPCV